MLGTSKSVWGFDPRSVPGCQLWLDGADTSSMTLSGSSVTQWNDKSGNGRNLTAVSGYANATVSSAFQNGLNVFNFSGNGLYRTVANSAVYPQDVYIIVALKSLTAQSDVLAMGPTDADNFNSLIFSEGTQSRWKNGSSNGVRNVFSTTDETSTGFLLIQWSIANNNYLLRRNGTLLAQSSSFTYSLPGGSIFQVGFRHTNITAANFSGYIGEIVVFNNQLGDTQRQQVEGYLAHKWGLVGPSPTIPLSVPGCQLWLDGADPAGTGTPPADGATVSTWVDKSGNGYNATAAPSRTAGTYSTSFRAVNFPNSTTGYITNYSAAPTNETMFVVFNNPSPSGNNNILIGGVSGARSLGAGYTAAGTGTVGNLNTQVVWLASTGTYTAGTTVFTTSQFTPSSNSVSLNGGTFSTGGAPGFTAGRVTYLGVDATNPVYYYIGYAMEILFYNSVLTTTQRQTIETYLAKKWSIGSASTIPSTHPFYSVRPHLRVFRPTDVTGCQLWLDAADSSVVTIATGVSQWRDKSGNANNLTQSTTGNQPTYTSNLITFSNNTYLNVPQAVMNNLPTWSVFFVINPISSSNWILAKQRDGVNTYNVLSMTYNTTNGGGGQTGSTGFLYWRSLNHAGQLVSTAAITTSALQIWNLTYDGTNLYFYKNGVLEKTIAGSFAGANDTNATAYTMGAWIQGVTINNSGVTNFRLGEMIVYTSAITSSQRQQIEGYLAHKWGLIASPTTPLSIPGCQIWLDAGDSSTVTGTSTVTQWRDKSGNARHLSAGSGTTSYSSNAIQVNNSYLYVESPVDLSKFTVFVVAKTTGGNNQTVFSGRPNPANNDEDWDSVDGFAFFMDYQNSIRFYGQYNSVSSFSVNTSTPQVFSFQSSGTSLSAWYNGISQSGATLSSTRTTTAQGFIVGGSWSGSSYYNVVANASVYEAITYNTILTASQRQTIESYLANKWSIGSTSSSSLASTHPFSIFPPASLHTIATISATGGTIVSTSGVIYHVFTSSGSFVVSTGRTMNYLVVGGGGGGGDRHGGGGGGGGVLSGSWTATTTTYTVTVGAGGIHGATTEDGQIPYGSPQGAGSKGGDSLLSGTGISVTAYGGGGGGTYDGNPGGTVGSGGGGGGQNLSGVAGTAGQGNAGGAGLLPGAGGGGGAGGAGVAANTGTGGIGTSSFSTHLLAAGYGTTFAVPTSPNIVISGGVAYIAGGGGGCAGTSPGPGGNGGLGGGGRGDWTDSFISAGTPNTGGGGGGTRSDLGLLYSIGRDGGSGLVLVWY